MASDDEDDYVVFGSPLLEEADAGAGAFRRPKQDPAATKALPVWQQEVTDAEGRRRFHGAFTGGYSAGFFNTVGSKEGWAPREFRSTRGQRTESRAQTAEDFMDDDELQEVRAQSLRTTADFDTFGHAAGARAREAAAASVSEARPGLPSAVPAELIMPVPDSIGIRLLQRMGWRQGRGVGQAAAGGGGGGKWGRMASLGAESAPLHSLPPKQDTFGLGFDPYQGAEEFRAGKRPAEQGSEDSRFAAAKKRQKRGVAFGTGALDEDDSYGVADDYVTDAHARETLSLTIVSDEEDDDRPALGAGQRRLGGGAERLALPSAADVQRRALELVPGFVRAREAEAAQAFPPPRVPRDFVPKHTFAPRSSVAAADLSAGGEPPQPRAAVLRAITTIAPYVARVGPAFEALAIQKNAGEADFAFLTGGEGAAYYRWSVRAAKAAAAAAGGQQIGQRSAPLTADSRGAMLGEVALASGAPPAADPAAAAAAAPTPAPAAPVSIAAGDRAALQETLQSTFARGSQQDMGFGRGVGLQPGAGAAKGPAQGPPAAPGGLQATGSRFASGGTFEGGGLQAGGLSVAKPQPAAPPAAGQAQPARGPKRTVEEWQPPPLLCKRFNVPDPFKGRRTEEERGPALRVDALALPETAAAAAAAQAALPLPPPPPAPQQAGRSGPPVRGPAGATAAPANAAPALPPPPPPGPKQQADMFLDSLLGGPGPAPRAAAPQQPPPVAAAAAPAAPIERPIDLFKAIFEDGDESEGEEPEEAAEQPQEAAAAAEPVPGRPEAGRPAVAEAVREPRPGAGETAQPGSARQGGAAMDGRPAPGGAPAAERAPSSSGRSLSPPEQRRAAAAAEAGGRPSVQEALALLGSEAARDKKRHRERHKHKKEHKKSKKSKKERHRD